MRLRVEPVPKFDFEPTQSDTPPLVCRGINGGCLNRAPRDLLFISYAWEDEAFADWLALKLRAEGYRIWKDKNQLLGGESMSDHFEDAIKNRTFRLLALMSKHSAAKPTPRRERALAVTTGQHLKIKDFLIPLNADGLSPHELDFSTTDTVYIPFNKNWAAGFRGLLAKLQAVDAPKDPQSGRRSVCDWYASQAIPSSNPETLWSNLFKVTEIPKSVRRYRLVDLPKGKDLWRFWPSYELEDGTAWAFTPPPADLEIISEEIDSKKWKGHTHLEDVPTSHIITNLIRKSLMVFCLKKGLALTPNLKLLYFPTGLLEQDKLKFRGIHDENTYVLVSGVRKAYRNAEKLVQYRHHLGASFSFQFEKFGTPVLNIIPKIYVTDLAGQPLKNRSALSRRKKIAKAWFNHHWANRTLGIGSWLGDGKPTATIVETREGSLQLSTIPMQMECDKGIDESKLKREVDPSIEDFELSLDGIAADSMKRKTGRQSTDDEDASTG